MEGQSKEASRPGPGQPVAGNLITFDDFLKLHLRVAKVVEAMDHPKADKLLVLKVDLGGEQRQLVAGIKGHYQPQELVGKNIVIVSNLQPRMMRGYESQGMLLAAVTEAQDKIVLVTVDRDIPLGTKVS